jgi:hypothetical protein
MIRFFPGKSLARNPVFNDLIGALAISIATGLASALVLGAVVLLLA